MSRADDVKQAQRWLATTPSRRRSQEAEETALAGLIAAVRAEAFEAAAVAIGAFCVAVAARRHKGSYMEFAQGVLVEAEDVVRALAKEGRGA